MRRRSAAQACSGSPSGSRSATLFRLDRGPLMFAFFSNRLGCFGSIVVSIIGTLFLLALMNLLFR
jgi:hypothetical protein